MTDLATRIMNELNPTCEFCGARLIPRDGELKVAPQRKHCDHACTQGSYLRRKAARKLHARRAAAADAAAFRAEGAPGHIPQENVIEKIFTTPTAEPTAEPFDLPSPEDRDYPDTDPALEAALRNLPERPNPYAQFEKPLPKKDTLK